MTQTNRYSPHDQLPMPEPKTVSYPPGYFYDKTAKYLIKDAIRIMDNGLSIDMDKVIELEEVLKDNLEQVANDLSSNKLIKQYLELRYSNQIKNYKKDRQSKMRDPSYYETDFKYNNMVHRSYFMDIYAASQGWSSPEEKLPSGVGKWPASLVKKYAKTNKLLDRLLKGELPNDTPAVIAAMDKLAKDKTEVYNKKYLDQVNKPDVPYPTFNPASSLQKRELFELLGIESEAMSKDTGLPKWDREQVERVNASTSDDDVRELTQCLIDHSFTAIVKNNFIEAFYTYTVEDRLYGQYKLLGAKSGRFTSSNPNMLNMPSTKSRFAKPIKRCFTAPKGKIVLAADYSALEDRVIASLSRDTNKCDIFLKNLDGHSLNALGYFPDRIKEIIPLSGDTVKDTLLFKSVVDDKTHPKNKIADAIRQESKAPTFGLAYGAFPPKVASSLKIPINEAEEIFNNYHNVLYPGITKYREDYVMATAQAEGEIHLGMGFYLKTDNPGNDIRTLANATCQFWSILTALTINKMHQLIDEKGYQDDVVVTSTIYDSIYFEVTEDPEIIKWVNDNLIRIMLMDFMEDQTIPNESASDLGFNWADMLTISNGASIEEIKETLKQLRSQ